LVGITSGVLKHMSVFFFQGTMNGLHAWIVLKSCVNLHLSSS